MSMFHELMMRKKEEIMYATIKGSLTENDGVFSGFSSSNYLQVPNFNQEMYNQYLTNSEIVIKFRYTTTATNANLLNFSVSGDNNNGIYCFATSGRINWQLNSGSYRLQSEQNTFSVGVDYWVKTKISNNTATLSYSTDGINFIVLTTLDISSMTKPTLSNNFFNIGSGYTGAFNGSIDLPNSYIKLGSTKYKIVAVPEE